MGIEHIHRDLAQAVTVLREAVTAQRAQPAGYVDVCVWGSALSEIVSALRSGCRVVERQLVHYGDDRLPRDDTGADPYERLGQMRRYLAALELALSEAAVMAEAYHEAAGHLSVAVDPNPGTE